MNWINDFLAEVTGVETPERWLKWGAISTIAAIAAPNVFMNRGGKYRLRPNLYVLLIGPSGLGKAFALTTSRTLVKLVGTTRLITGRATIEGIMKDLATTTMTPNGSIPFKDARGYFNSGEFAASIHKNTAALDILTDLYDAHDNPDWQNTLKSSPVERLRFPCLSIFSGANQDMFNEAIPRTHLYGGFIGRTLLIVENEKTKYNPLSEDSPEINYNGLIEHLKEVSKIEGKLVLSAAATAYYNDWYMEFQSTNKAKFAEDKTGTTNRLHDHIHKVSMCISLAKRLTKVIELDDWMEAQELVLGLSKSYKSITGGHGDSSTSKYLRAFLGIIMKQDDYKINRQTALSRGFGDFNSIELDSVVEHLIQVGFLTQRGTDPITYKVTDAGIKFWYNRIQKT